MNEALDLVFQMGCHLNKTTRLREYILSNANGKGKVMQFTQRHGNAKHGKMHLAIENRREAIRKKRISIRGPEPNFYQLVVSVNKSLSLLKPPAAICFL